VKVNDRLEEFLLDGPAGDLNCYSDPGNHSIKKKAIPNRNDFTSTKSIEYSHQTHGLMTILSQYPSPLDPATNVVSDIPGMFDLA
jgi:hypothetical protein